MQSQNIIYVLYLSTRDITAYAQQQFHALGRKYNISLHLTVAPTCIETLHLQKDTQLVAPPLPRVLPDSLQYPLGYVDAVPHRSRSDSGGDGVMNALSYLTNILTSKVYDVAIQSSLQLTPKLSRKLGVKVWLKRKDLQPVFSFKIRGAYNMMAKLPKELLEKGVICSAVIVM
ncbi:hypothetical protein VIGAN_10062100 [Vigna angularis var. angularis]|uniref:Tryptophan synthase beta chain-like PALP domain-containing protein n=1 Tax=Vigna angularis var. angularis TaxID=157739 RepID=A0A0S3T2H9_PHAAN|nr:hypothetical protein VIGAN_10062100 [Vigna angularis var. angularis]